MVKRRIPGGMHRRSSRAVRAVRRDAYTHTLSFGFDALAPVFGPTILCRVALPCASCPDSIVLGQPMTMIDHQWNCASCTEEARRG